MKFTARFLFTGFMLFCLTVSVGWSQGIDTNTTDLPPDGLYFSQDGLIIYSGLGLVFDDPGLDPDVTTTIRTPIGNDELETFDAVFTAIEIGLGVGPITLVGIVEVITFDRLLSPTGTFNAEIVNMSLSGNTPLGPVLMRESPILPSPGITDITDLGGGLYHIDSFFDVFTELSLDGGMSWFPADDMIHLDLIPVPGAPTATPTDTPTITPTPTATVPAGIDTTTTLLPPDGVYTTYTDTIDYSFLGISMDEPALDPDVTTTVRTPLGNDEIELFDAEFTCDEIGLGYGPLTLTGPVEVITEDRLLSTTGTFNAEIVSMSLSGNSPGGPILMREDPTLMSTGITDIQDLGGGIYHIDSFFDVFTELSVDGGMTWVPSDTSTRLVLYPVPGLPTPTPTTAPTETPTDTPTGPTPTPPPIPATGPEGVGLLLLMISGLLLLAPMRRSL